ncbi:Transcriptional regulatory protein TdiR [Starkeya nomas]|uniref:Transcriptional regulatory protein TdiR n=2 Tax=Xanthobacteraceae TaxID=335928 RepID=A0A5S9NDG8_9HYPH|nr:MULTISPECIES: response regulator [Xanthobacteraceae]TSJ64693.1 response regulator transcription factor [Ancylobacter moscoviensis]CAA0086439.1 Transcriptional regulatory protein TdiR [Starkeya nomas]
MAQLGEIFIVDDDAAVRDALSLVLSLEGYHVRGFSDGAAFLSVARSHVPSCVVLDVHMPGRSGLDILKELEADRYPAPIFIISGQGDIPMAVDAIRHGALDFIEKPFDADTVVERVREAIEAHGRRGMAEPNDLLTAHFPGHELLTPREREVLVQIASGASNKEAGRKLGISPRTIEVHRARIMEKLGAKNAADLVRIVLKDMRA